MKSSISYTRYVTINELENQLIDRQMPFSNDYLECQDSNSCWHRPVGATCPICNLECQSFEDDFRRPNSKRNDDKKREKEVVIKMKRKKNKEKFFGKNYVPKINCSSSQGLGEYLDCQGFLPDFINPLGKLQNFAIDSISTRLEGFDNTHEMINSLVNKLNDFVKSCSLDVDIGQTLKQLIIALGFSLYQHSVTPLLQFALGAVSSIIGEYLKVAILWAFPQLAPYFGVAQVLQTQDSLEISSAIRALFVVLSTIMATFYKMPNMDYVTILNKLSLVGRSFQGITNINKFLEASFDAIEECFGKWKYGDSYSIRKMDNKYPYLNTSIDILNHFRSNGNVKEVLGANKTACKLLRWSYQHVCQICDESLVRGQRELHLRLKEFKRDMKELNMYAETLLFSKCQSRIAPVVVFLHGHAGTGKTQLLEMLCQELSKKYYHDTPVRALKYARKAENEYWDGYRPEHRIVTYDDIFQLVDSAAKPNPEVMEIIRVSNSESYQLHMSAVEDKNNTFFNADFVFATSNASNFSPKSISCPDALARRFDFKVEVKTKDSFGRRADSGSHLVPDPRKVWAKQNPDKTMEDMIKAMTDGSFSTFNDACVYELDVKYTYYGKKEQKTMSFDEFFKAVEHKRREKEQLYQDNCAEPLNCSLSDQLLEMGNKLKDKLDLDEEELATIEGAFANYDNGTAEEDDFIDCEDGSMFDEYPLLRELENNISLERLAEILGKYPEVVRMLSNTLLKGWIYPKALMTNIILTGFEDVTSMYFGWTFKELSQEFLGKSFVDSIKEKTGYDPEVVFGAVGGLMFGLFEFAMFMDCADSLRHSQKLSLMQFMMCRIPAILLHTTSGTGLLERMLNHADFNMMMGEVEGEGTDFVKSCYKIAAKYFSFRLAPTVIEKARMFITNNETVSDFKDSCVDKATKLKQAVAKLLPSIAFNFDYTTIKDSAMSFLYFLKSHILKIAGLAVLMGIGWRWFTKCTLVSKLENGASLLEILETRLCSCKFCKRVKESVVPIRLASNFVPLEYTQVTLRMLTQIAYDMGVKVNQNFCFMSVPRITTNHTGEFTFFEPRNLKAYSRHGDAEDHYRKKMNPESYQESKVRNLTVESHQDSKPRNLVVESHQDKQARNLVVESHQEKQTRNLIVESYQDKPVKNLLVESSRSAVEAALDAVFSQASFDDNTSQIVKKLFAKNLVQLRNPVTGAMVHGLFVRGHWMLVNKHFYDHLNGTVQMRSFGTSEFDEKPIAEMKSILRGGQEVDLCSVRIGGMPQSRPDIVKYFPNVSELSLLRAGTSDGVTRLVKSTTFTQHGEQVLIPMIETVANVRYEDYKQSRHKTGQIYHIRQGISCTANTERGDCGSPYVMFNPSMRPKIFGIHAAGAAGYACGVIVTQEDFDVLITQDICPDYQDLNIEYDTILPNTTNLGKVRGVAQPTQTKIRPTSLNGVFPVKTAPAVLRDREEDILLKNTLKITKKTEVLDEALLDICQNDIMRVLGYSGKDARILTHEESIKGIDGYAYINSINAQTSAGYPYVLETGGMPGKTKWLGMHGEYRTDDIEVIQHVERIEEAARKGVYLPKEGIFNASLKDERRTHEKVQAKKTRVFAASNLGLSLVIRKYFMFFMQHIMDKRIDNEIGLGMNAYSLDWRRLVHRLKRQGDNIIAGDFSNFDGSLNAQILTRIADVVSDWYCDGQENKLIRQVLFRYLTQSTWLLRDTLIQLDHSQPSGNPLTTMINCLYNMFIFRYTYLLAQKENGFTQQLVDYTKRVSAVYYGDDSIISVDDETIKWFNQITITDLMLKTGHIYTDESKSTALLPSKPLSECTFLKRGFNKIEGNWAASLSTDTIKDMIMWRKKTTCNEEAIIEVVRHASFEAFLHGPEFFHDFTDTVRAACQQNNVPYSGLAYGEARNFWLSQLNSHLQEDEFISLLYTI